MHVYLVYHKSAAFTTMEQTSLLQEHSILVGGCNYDQIQQLPEQFTSAPEGHRRDGGEAHIGPSLNGFN